MIHSALSTLLLLPFFSYANILEGIAKNPKGEVVYIETHTVELDSSGLSKLIHVEYTKPDGKKFATMKSDFSKNKTAPDTVFEDSRFKSKIVVRNLGESIEFEELKNDKSILKKQFPLKTGMVISQGFDNFIKMNSKQLDEQPIDFKFGVLDTKDFYSLTGQKKSTPSGEAIEYGIRASNWLLRIFASELRVVYDPKNMKLKSFSGRSNILNDAEKSQDVTITYQWKEKQ